MKELGHKVQIIVHIDSSAALGVLERKGIGKIRHLVVAESWMQAVIKQGKIYVAKIDGSANDADLMTKPLTRQAIDIIMERIGGEYM